MHVQDSYGNHVIARLVSGLLVFIALVITPMSAAESLDVQVAQDNFLSALVGPLDDLSVDVTVNVNNRELGRGRPDNPRLGGFWDVPEGLLPSAQELSFWEAEYAAGQIGAVAVISCDKCDLTAAASPAGFLDSWFNSMNAQRVFISFASADAQSAQGIADVLGSTQQAVKILTDSSDSTFAGELYATAGRRLVVDSRESRRLDSDVTEFAYLGERSRRGSESIFSQSDASRGLGLARNEPSVFLKESLGDEFNQSTIEEIIVPGGVALGETARLNLTPSSLEFSNNKLILTDDSGAHWELPDQALSYSRALFDFVERSALIQSDAIVDIDENARVSISSALRDTDVGYEIMHADTQPFEFIPNLPVTKSVVIDTFVKWTFNAESGFSFDTEFEVRFLSADNMRIAQTRAALVYDYQSTSGLVSYRDAWGREARRLNDKVDYVGLGSSMEKVAHYAGWIALFRKLKEDEVPFLRGRYDFMKINTAGRETPTRY